MQIIGKSRVSLKNEVITKQKRLLHEVTLFDVDLVQFVGLIESVSFGNIILFSSVSGIDVSFGYLYQGHQFTYYLNSDHIAEFKVIAEQKGFKVIKYKL